jgi:hypothetical protein
MKFKGFTLLCSSLVCKRPRSPKFERQTMSSLPIFVAKFSAFGSLAISGIGWQEQTEH